MEGLDGWRGCVWADLPFEEVLLARCGEWARRGRTEKGSVTEYGVSWDYNNSHCLS